MSASITSSMASLQAADPAVDIDVAALAPDWESVVAAIDADVVGDAELVTGRQLPGRERARRRSRRVRLAAAAVTVAVAATVVGAIAWPQSDHRPTLVAYGVTRKSDGTVAVRRSPTQPFTSTDLQAQLRAAGVPAAVLTESPAGACSEALPIGVPSAGPVITYPSDISRGDGFLIHPDVIPAGAVLIVVLPPITTSGVRSTTTPAFAGLYVTLVVPTCVAKRAEHDQTLSPSK